MMNFFGTKIQPVLYVDVNVYPEFNRSEIVVRRAETVGSETADKVNGTFSISAINIVSAGMTGGKNHCSSGSIRCSLLMRNLNLPILPCVHFSALHIFSDFAFGTSKFSALYSGVQKDWQGTFLHMKSAVGKYHLPDESLSPVSKCCLTSLFPSLSGPFN
jgi:hypothetical protein